MKIQTKITALFSILCTSIITLLSVAIYYFTYKNASQDFYTRLELRALIAGRASLERNPDTAAFNQIRREHLRRLTNEKEFIIRADTLNRLRHSTAEAELPADLLGAITTFGKASYRNDFDFFEGIQYMINNEKYIIIVSAENAELKSLLGNLQKILITGSVVSMIIIFSIGLLFSKQILAPIRNVTRQVNRITGTSLHLRLNVKKGKDEISVLSNTFNTMLDRLETAFESQNNFVSNASHELNTPLTAIIGEADYALSKSRSVEQYQQSLQVIMQQGDKLKHITESLVQLARSGFHENLAMQPVDISEILHNARHNAQNVYSNCTINYSLDLNKAEHAPVVTANPQLLELALSNVILNACKYSNGLPVTVSLNHSGFQISIIVADKGIGIPQDELKNIFDPFFRASNVRAIDGYGIGLPLTQNIIRLHKGSIDIHSAVNQGTEVLITLPVSTIMKKNN